METVTVTTKGESKSRKRLIPFLHKLLNEGRVPQLCWVDKEQSIWQMPWKHHKPTSWGDPDAFMLLEYAKGLHGYTGNNEPEKEKLSHWKELFRNALRSLKDVDELSGMHMPDGDNPYKVYRFVNSTPNGKKRHNNKNATDFRRKNHETAQSSQNEAAITCRIPSGHAPNYTNGLHFLENSQNHQFTLASGLSFVSLDYVQEQTCASSSSFQQCKQTNDVPNHPRNNHDDAISFPRSQMLPSTSSTDNSTFVSNSGSLDQLLSDLNICPESSILGHVENPFRSRSPLGNGAEAENVGNIPLIIANATEIDIDDTMFINDACPSAVNIPFNLLTSKAPKPESIMYDAYHVPPMHNTKWENSHNVVNFTDELLVKTPITFLYNGICVAHNGNSVTDKQNFVADESNFVTHDGNFVTHNGSFVVHDGNSLTHDGNLVKDEANLATFIDGNTMIANGLNSIVNSTSAYIPSADLTCASDSVCVDKTVLATPELNLENYVNRILDAAPPASLVVVAYYLPHHPVKCQIMTRKFRICFVPNDDSRKGIMSCPDPQQFGPNDVDMFELPEVGKLPKPTNHNQNTQKVLNNLHRGVIIDIRYQDVYATRYCKAVPHFCIPEATQFQKMERLQEVKIFDFQSNFSHGLDTNFRYHNSKPCVRLAFAVKDANKKASALTVDIWHKEAYRMTQGSAENTPSMEPDCSISDEYDTRLEIEQELKQIELSLYTRGIHL